ncbi:ATP synthase epsilon chain [Clostridium tepidiprofundi DSM 19306]|uniref:ATP synthase epsilon chain n=2 Tax=Clostridium TaxID=1485 RepID=A0A151B4S5_9CLOT|nr:ATP synthase epsilon chain [Clostridium tepidiprofundi DSM 19306]
MGKMDISVLTPQSTFYSGEISKLFVTDINGSLGILPNHSPLITVLIPSTVRFVSSDGGEKEFSISQGILKVINNKIVILCDECKWKSEP